MRFWGLAAKDPDRVAVVDPDGRETTAGELLARANRIVHGLRALGLEGGDNVAVVLPNGHEYLAVYLAVMQAGMYMTPVNNHLAGPEIGYILKDCEAGVVVGSARNADTLQIAAAEAGMTEDRCFSVGDIPGFTPLRHLERDESAEAPSNRRAGGIMYYTSGTTGRPKGVRRPLPDVDPDDVADAFDNLLGLLGIETSPDDVHLCGSPLYHTAVLSFAAASLHLGQPVVIMDKWRGEDMLDLIKRYKVTNSHMVPTQFNRLLQLPDDVRAAADVSSLRYIIHGAAPCAPDVKKRMIEWWGPVIYEYYGTTEGGGTIVRPEEWLAHPGTVGRPWPGAEIRILDDDGKDMPVGEAGTVYLKLQGQAFEYYKDTAKTMENRRAGFFTVGDIGLLDEDGYLYLRDRKSDLVISGGVNLYPAEVEAVLGSHPAVGDVAVFGIPDNDLGEKLHAVIEPVAGRVGDDALLDELRAYCEGRLGKFKVPRSMEFTDALPRDPNGKLFKRKLRAPFWEGMERSI